MSELSGHWENSPPVDLGHDRNIKQTTPSPENMAAMAESRSPPISCGSLGTEFTDEVVGTEIRLVNGETPLEYEQAVESAAGTGIQLVNGETPLEYEQAGESAAETIQAVESISQEVSDIHSDDVTPPPPVLDVQDDVTHHELQPIGTAEPGLVYESEIHTLQPATVVTHIHPAGFDQSGQFGGSLLPKEDVEAFFSTMDRPTATTVTLGTQYTETEGSQLTTLTNAPISLAHSATAFQNFVGLQTINGTMPHSTYTDGHSYLQTMHSLHASPTRTSGLLHYPVTSANSGGDSPYSNSRSPHEHKYSPYTNPLQDGRTDNLGVQINRSNQLPSYTGFLTQDIPGFPNFISPGKYIVLVCG